MKWPRGSEDGQYHGPHGEESMLPSWLCYTNFDSNHHASWVWSPTVGHESGKPAETTPSKVFVQKLGRKATAGSRTFNRYSASSTCKRKG